MTPAPLRSVMPDIQVFLWRFGWAWPLAIAACLLALGLFLTLHPVRVAVASARADLVEAEDPKRGAVPLMPASTDAQRVQAIRAALRGPAEATQLIRRLGELARAEQITLAQGEYVQQRDPDTGLVLLRVTQPVKAGYPQLKRYVESVLRSTPNVSLDQIAARRDNVAQAQIEARLRWTFWIAEEVK